MGSMCCESYLRVAVSARQPRPCAGVPRVPGTGHISAGEPRPSDPPSPGAWWGRGEGNPWPGAARLRGLTEYSVNFFNSLYYFLYTRLAPLGGRTGAARVRPLVRAGDPKRTSALCLVCRGTPGGPKRTSAWCLVCRGTPFAALSPETGAWCTVGGRGLARRRALQRQRSRV